MANIYNSLKEYYDELNHLYQGLTDDFNRAEGQFDQNVPDRQDLQPGADHLEEVVFSCFEFIQGFQEQYLNELLEGIRAAKIDAQSLMGQFSPLQPDERISALFADAQNLQGRIEALSRSCDTLQRRVTILQNVLTELQATLGQDSATESD